MPLDLRNHAADALREGARLRIELIDTCLDATIEAANRMSRCLDRGGKILFFGNGGSAADAQHLAAEFIGGFGHRPEGLPALALTTDSSAVTALGNDFGFDEVFSRQVRAVGRTSDLAVAISTSGRSKNVLAGIRTARDMGMDTVALTGRGGGELAALADVAIVIPSDSVARIQECHIALGHLMCEMVDLGWPTSGGNA